MPALTIRAGTTLESLNAHGVGHLPGWFGFEAVGLAPGRLSARMLIRPEMLAPDGSLHAAAIIALADTAALLAHKDFHFVTPAEAATGAYSLRGRVTADLRWIEPSDETTVVPLEATEGNISLLLNADTPIAIRLNMGSGAVAVNLGLGLHEVGEPALTNYSFATAGSRAILLGRGIAEIGEATQG